MSRDDQANPSAPPYPEHECEGCDQGKKLLVGKYSSIVGQGAIHLPEGWVCMKYTPPKAYSAFRASQRPR